MTGRTRRSGAQLDAERRYEGKRRGQPRLTLRLTDEELAHLEAVAWPGESRVATVRRALMSLTPQPGRSLPQSDRE